MPKAYRPPTTPESDAYAGHSDSRVQRGRLEAHMPHEEKIHLSEWNLGFKEKRIDADNFGAGDGLWKKHADQLQHQMQLQHQQENLSSFRVENREAEISLLQNKGNSYS